MVIGLLGILKSGGGYVPVDPASPRVRTEAMLAEVGARVLAVSDGVLERLGLETDAAVVRVEELGAEAQGPEVEILAEDTAYVIYTSGSTGRPKGVEITHGSLENVLRSMREEPGFGAGDTMLAVTSVAFDIAAAEIFLPLTVGGRVELS